MAQTIFKELSLKELEGAQKVVCHLVQVADDFRQKQTWNYPVKKVLSEIYMSLSTFVLTQFYRELAERRYFENLVHPKNQG